MLKKTSGKEGGGAAVGSSPAAPGLMRRELARHSNGGVPSSPLLLSPRSLSSLFSMDAPLSPTSMVEESKNQPRSSSRKPRPNGQSRGAGLAAVLVAGEVEREHRTNGRVLLGMRLRVQLPSVKGLSGGGYDLPSSPIEFGLRRQEQGLPARAALPGAAVAAVVGGGEGGAERSGGAGGGGLHLRHRPGAQPQDDPHIR